MADHIVLVGLMGTGKSTAGREVARRLRRPFLDSDDQIESRTGRTVREIWTSDGEPVYRRMETEVLAAALDDDRPSVIAAAGGVVLDAGNRERLRAASTVVWLDAEPGVLVGRAVTGEHRPLLDDDPEAAMRSMATERRTLYEEVATARIDVTSLAPDAVVERIMAIVEARVDQS
jgi:shikimate kinase